jgi:hypothetical protein
MFEATIWHSPVSDLSIFYSQYQFIVYVIIDNLEKILPFTLLSFKEK